MPALIANSPLDCIVAIGFAPFSEETRHTVALLDDLPQHSSENALGLAGTNNCVNYTTIQQSPIDIIYGSVSSALVTNNAILDPKLPASLAVTYPPTSDYKARGLIHSAALRLPSVL